EWVALVGTEHPPDLGQLALQFFLDLADDSDPLSGDRRVVFHRPELDRFAPVLEHRQPGARQTAVGAVEVAVDDVGRSGFSHPASVARLLVLWAETGEDPRRYRTTERRRPSAIFSAAATT